MRLFRRSIWMLALGLLSGCALFPAGEEGGPPPAAQFEKSPSDQNLSELLSFYAASRQLSEPALKQALLAQRGATSPGCDLSRLRLGLLQLHAAERGATDSELAADDVLVPCLQAQDAEPGLLALAILIHTQLSELDGQRQRLVAGQKELDAARKENLELKRQLEELKAIERSLQDRRRR